MFNAAGAAAQGKRWKFPLGKLSGPVMTSFLQELDAQRAVALTVDCQVSLSCLPHVPSSESSRALGLC